MRFEPHVLCLPSCQYAKLLLLIARLEPALWAGVTWWRKRLFQELIEGWQFCIVWLVTVIFLMQKKNVFSFHQLQYSKYGIQLCKSAHMSCLDSAPVCCYLHFWPNPVPSKHVRTDCSGAWICLLSAAGYCFELLCLKLESFMSLIWLWANTDLLVKQGKVTILDPKIKHFLPAVTPVSTDEC